MGDKCEICEKAIERNDTTGYLDIVNKKELVHMICWLNAQVLVARHGLGPGFELRRE